MKQSKPVLTLLAAAAFMAGTAVLPSVVPQANAQISFHFGWQQPPHEYNRVQQQGFHAGIEAARRDIDHGMPPDPHRHEDFRRPHVEGRFRDDFRHAFQHGYETAYQHRTEWDRNRHDWGAPGE